MRAMSPNKNTVTGVVPTKESPPSRPQDRVLPKDVRMCGVMRSSLFRNHSNPGHRKNDCQTPESIQCNDAGRPSKHPPPIDTPDSGENAWKLVACSDLIVLNLRPGELSRPPPPVTTGTKKPTTSKPITWGMFRRMYTPVRMGTRGTTPDPNGAHATSSPPGPTHRVVVRLRDDSTTAVKGSFTKQVPDPRTRLHKQFRRETKEYDQDSYKEYQDDLLYTDFCASFLMTFHVSL